MGVAELLSITNNLVKDIQGQFVPGNDLETTISSLSLRTVYSASLILVAATIIAALLKDKLPKIKLPLFIIMSFVMTFSTLVLAVSTVYLNVKSDSGGPIHWHADMEIWVCGQEIELRDPVGFSNKIGTSTLHEHDDHRIHLEGVAVNKEEDASLGKFFHVIGGAITDDAMVAPLNPSGENILEDEYDGDGEQSNETKNIDKFIVNDSLSGRFIKVNDGATCGDGQAADVQTYVYRYNEKDDTYSQQKLADPKSWVIYSDSNVPPGDCIIVEVGPASATTDKLCKQYGIRDVEKCEKFGVKQDEKEVCTIKEVKNPNADKIIDSDNPAAICDAATTQGECNDTGSSGNICEPFFNEDGTPKNPRPEIAAIKSDGSTLDPDKDCQDYVDSLKEAN